MKKQIIIDNEDVFKASDRVSGTQETIKMLTRELGRMQRVMWNIIDEAYPETKEGRWSFMREGNVMKLIKEDTNE